MQREQKLAILMDGQKNGVSDTCKKYQISRTLYYRWLKRYQTMGVVGLDKVTKDFIPVNKTAPNIVAVLLTLIKKQPHYGPRALKYLLDDYGFEISESAVYNILKSHQLSTKQQRVTFAKKREVTPQHEFPSLSDLSSGEGWLFWTTHIGHFGGIGNLYTYTFLDCKSKISCSRLYTSLSIEYFENLLTAVAMPVAQTFRLDAKYLHVSKEDAICGKNGDSFLTKIEKLLHAVGFEIEVNHTARKNEEKSLQHIKNEYNQICLSALLPWIQDGLTLTEIKMKFQQQLRDYNHLHQSLYDQQLYSPIEYHSKSKNIEMILPLWAYIDRDY